MAIGNMQKNFCKDCVCGSGDILIDRRVDTHTYTDMLITVHAHPIRRRSNY